MSETMTNPDHSLGFTWYLCSSLSGFHSHPLLITAAVDIKVEHEIWAEDENEHQHHIPTVLNPKPKKRHVFFWHLFLASYFLFTLMHYMPQEE